MFFESKEVKEFKKKHFDDITAANSLISDLRKSQVILKEEDPQDILKNIFYINNFKHVLDSTDFIFETIDLMTFVFIRYVAGSTIPELEQDPEGVGKNINSLQVIRRQTDLVLSLISNNKNDIVSSIFEMKNTGKWPPSFNDTNWLGIFKSPDNFLKWTLSKTNDNNPKLMFASGKIMARIGSLFRVIDAISRL